MITLNKSFSWRFCSHQTELLSAVQKLLISEFDMKKYRVCRSDWYSFLSCCRFKSSTMKWMKVEMSEECLQSMEIDLRHSVKKRFLLFPCTCILGNWYMLTRWKLLFEKKFLLQIYVLCTKIDSFNILPFCCLRSLSRFTEVFVKCGSIFPQFSLHWVKCVMQICEFMFLNFNDQTKKPF